MKLDDKYFHSIHSYGIPYDDILVNTNEKECPSCGGCLVRYDIVKRIAKGAGGSVRWLQIERLRCEKCCKVHRVIPNDIYPYKHYTAAIIDGVRNGSITPYDLEYEDYPCEMTMKRWMKTI